MKQITILSSFFLFAIFSLIWTDYPLALYFFSWDGSAFSHLFASLSELGRSHYYLFPSLLIYFIWRYQDSRLSKAALVLFLSVALSGILVNILKIIFGRARPKLLEEQDIYGFFWFEWDSLHASFPSGHAATAMAVFTVLSLLFPKYRYSFLLFFGLIALSRVFIHAHFLSDVIIGGIIGYLCAKGVIYFFGKRDLTTA